MLNNGPPLLPGEIGAVICKKLPPSSSNVRIPSDDKDDQPPHRQAAAYYRERVEAVGGEFNVTMEHPTKTKPEPLVIEIDGSKARIKKRFVSGAAAVITSRAPRAGL
jgi:hypothetical protein